MVKFHVCLQPTKEEITDGLERAQTRRAGTARLVVQTIALIFAASWSLVAFVGDGFREPMSAVIGVVALVLIPVMWLVPRWQRQSLAQMVIDSGNFPKLWVFEEGIDFGEEQPEHGYYTYHSFFVSVPTEETAQTLVFKFPNDDVIVVPKRQLTDDQWAFLVEKVTVSPKSAATW